MIFERAGAADAPALLALYNRAAQSSPDTDWDGSYPNAETIAEDLGESALYVLRSPAGIVAAITAHASAELDEDGIDWDRGVCRFCDLSRLCVEPALQGKGLAGHALDCAQRQARVLGFDGVRLLASLENPTACRLYQRRGYCPRGEVFKYGVHFLCFDCRLQ